MARPIIDNPSYFINRDLRGWSSTAACSRKPSDQNNPFLERLKFLSITASNLDEFFEVRVAALGPANRRRLQRSWPGRLDVDGRAGPDHRATLTISCDEQYRLLERTSAPAAGRAWHSGSRPARAGCRGRAFVEEYCERELDPLLTPVTVDPAHPFPRVINKALCVAFLLRRRRRSAMTYTGVVTCRARCPG